MGQLIWPRTTGARSLTNYSPISPSPEEKKGVTACDRNPSISVVPKRGLAYEVITY